jgi:hypothetical protein
MGNYTTFNQRHNIFNDRQNLSHNFSIINMHSEYFPEVHAPHALDNPDLRQSSIEGRRGLLFDMIASIIQPTSKRHNL